MKFNKRLFLFLICLLNGVFLLILFFKSPQPFFKKNIEEALKINIDSKIYYFENKTHSSYEKTSHLMRSAFGRCTNCIVLSVVCCLERTNETAILLKSAAVLSSSHILFILFTEIELFPYFRSVVSKWPNVIKKKVTLRLEELKYPSGANPKQWKYLFKPCASLRLFLPEILHDIDALIYVDTDVLFLSPLEDFWHHFKLMNSSHMAALSQEHEDPATGWYNRFARHPFYGKMGVNSGVMLMNLTRMRSFGWIEYLEPLYKEFNKVITWGDQDIINIIFHYHPDKLYLYGCEYNYRPDHCMYMSVCKSAESKGVFALHGSREVFHNDKQPAFKAIYNAWRNFTLGEDLRQHLFYPMQRFLFKTSKTNCGKLHSKTLLKRLSTLVKL